MASPRGPRRPSSRASAAPAELSARAAERLLAASPEARDPTDAPPRAVTCAALTRRLPAELRPHLDAALAALETSGKLLRLRHGRALLVVFGITRASTAADDALRQESAPAPPTLTLTEPEIIFRYAAVVADARGWPDVRLSALMRDPAELPSLHAVLTALWRAGRAVLSLGDWSLASEEQRAAALPLHGERYLLVRIDPA